MGLPAIVQDWKVRGYSYGKIIAPHDINVRSLSTGQTRKDTLHGLGCDVLVCPQHEVIDGINGVRALLSRAWFDREKCKDGIEALRQYRADWVEKKNVLQLRPLHDWASHSSDAMRYLAMHGVSQLQDQWGEINYSKIDQGIAA
jgi:phage terminase large subunit